MKSLGGPGNAIERRSVESPLDELVRGHVAEMVAAGQRAAARPAHPRRLRAASRFGGYREQCNFLRARKASEPPRSGHDARSNLLPRRITRARAALPELPSQERYRSHGL